MHKLIRPKRLRRYGKNYPHLIADSQNFINLMVYLPLTLDGESLSLCRLTFKILTLIWLHLTINPLIPSNVGKSFASGPDFRRIPQAWSKGVATRHDFQTQGFQTNEKYMAGIPRYNSTEWNRNLPTFGEFREFWRKLRTFPWTKFRWNFADTSDIHCPSFGQNFTGLGNRSVETFPDPIMPVTR